MCWVSWLCQYRVCVGWELGAGSLPTTTFRRSLKPTQLLIQWLRGGGALSSEGVGTWALNWPLNPNYRRRLQNCRCIYVRRYWQSITFRNETSKCHTPMLIRTQVVSNRILHVFIRLLFHWEFWRVLRYQRFKWTCFQRDTHQKKFALLHHKMCHKPLWNGNIKYNKYHASSWPVNQMKRIYFARSKCYFPFA
jgi:hypothetical protein